MKNKIIQIIPYFGKWPEYFDLYLYSCSRNKSVTFLFYTDCSIPDKVYSNTVFKTISYKDYCELVSNRLGIHFLPMKSYKLCDVRLFFGFIHERDIEGYDFWSYGDVDLLHGNLDILISKNNLETKDLITSQDYHLAGHFSVFRNNDYFRNIAFRIRDWKEKLRKPECIAMDELDFTRVLNPGMKYPIGLYNKILKYICHGCFHPMMGIYNRLNRPNMLFKNCLTSPEPVNDEVWTYDVATGKVYDPQNNELPYLHFLFFKGHPDPKRLHWNKDSYKLSDPIESYCSIKISLSGIQGVK